MGRQSRRKRGSKSRDKDRCPAPPEMRALVDRWTEDTPEARTAAHELVTVMEDLRFWRAGAQVSEAERMMMFLALKDAAIALMDRKPCDCCEAQATRIRYMLVQPGEDFRQVERPDGATAMMGFAILCDRCAEKSPGHARRKILDRLSAYQKEHGAVPYRRAAIHGLKVGEAGDLPRRPALQECVDCGQTIWIDQDAQEEFCGQTPPLFVCRDCFSKRMDSGRVDAVFVEATSS